MGVVPREFTGMARSFRATMLEHDRAYDRALNAVIAPIKTRLRRKPTLRPATITDTVRAWKLLPYQEYRLRPVEVLHEDEHELELFEQRVAAGRLVNPEWESPAELGLVVTTVRLRVSGGRMIKSLSASTVVSGHALGRRFERVRAQDRSSHAVIADIDALVDAPGNTLGWRGVDVMANDYGTARQVRDIRTWIWMD